MTIRINARYKQITNVAIWGIGVLAVLVSLLTLRPWFGFPLAVLAFVLTAVANSIVYRHTFLWVYPAHSAQTDAAWVGSAWFRETENDARPSVALLYERKEAAAEGYRLLRAWLGGKFNDKHRDLRVTLVKETETKYSTFIYPGDRKWKRNEIEEMAKAKIEGRSEVGFAVAKPYLHLCRDYRENQNMLEMVRSLPEMDWIHVNTAYLHNNDIHVFARKPIKTKLWVTERQQLGEQDLEFHLSWCDPKNQTPVKYERVKGLETRHIPAD